MANPAKAIEGADDGVTAAFELVLTPALFAFFGWLIDRWLNTTPLFVLLLAGVVATYEFWKLWSQYTTRMKSFEAELPDARGSCG